MTIWTAPRDWVNGEVPDEDVFNVHVRDNMLHLKEQIDETALKSVGFSSGAGNVGAGETDLTGFGFTLPANFLADGESIELVGAFALAANGNTKTLKFYLDGTNFATIFSSIGNGKVGYWYVQVTRRSNTTAAFQGYVILAPSAGGLVTGHWSINLLISSVDFTIEQTSKLTGQGGATGDIRMNEYSVRPWRGNASLV